jgi:hypothetical protein
MASFLVPHEFHVQIHCDDAIHAEVWHFICINLRHALTTIGINFYIFNVGNDDNNYLIINKVRWHVWKIGAKVYSGQLENPSVNMTIKLRWYRMDDKIFYQISIFFLLRVSQDLTSTGLCYVSPTVWISVGENNYAQRNMYGWGLNSRPPDSDTMMEDTPLLVWL